MEVGWQCHRIGVRNTLHGPDKRCGSDAFLSRAPIAIAQFLGLDWLVATAVCSPEISKLDPPIERLLEVSFSAPSPLPRWRSIPSPSFLVWVPAQPPPCGRVVKSVAVVEQLAFIILVFGGEPEGVARSRGSCAANHFSEGSVLILSRPSNT